MLREHPLGGGKVGLTLSSVECLGGFWALLFCGFGFEGFLGVGFVGILAVSFGFLLLVWSLLCILHVYFLHFEGSSSGDMIKRHQDRTTF